jgi:hypothetical protein
VSAFLCSARHLSALANATRALSRSYVRSLVPIGANWLQQPEEEEVFNVLFEANMDSLKARYPDAPHLSDHWCGTYTYLVTQPVPAAVAVLKLVQCYEYQACEHDGERGMEALPGTQRSLHRRAAGI